MIFLVMFKMVLVNVVMLRIVIIAVLNRWFNVGCAGDAGWERHRAVCGGAHHGGHMGGR